MQVTNNTKIAVFQPRTISITIETEKELSLLLALFQNNIRVPQALIEHGAILQKDEGQLQRMMGDLYYAI